MQHCNETALIDAIVDSCELDAIRIAALMLRAGVTMDILDDICSKAMQLIGRGFMPCPECIDDVAAADHIVDEIVNLEILARLETESALASTTDRR